MGFQKATKKQARLRMAITGPSGSGKTYTALSVARGLGEKVAVVDTERGSASKYSDEFSFDVQELESFHPQKYIDAIADAAKAGYEVLIIDSLSHGWSGKGGILEIVDQAASRSKSGNSFGAWRDATPLQNALLDAVLRAPMHVIVTMRSKMEYVLEQMQNGRTAPRKLGMAPVQRDGVEYEFDVVLDMDVDHKGIVSKTRCKQIADSVITKPDVEFGRILSGWLSDGAPNVLDEVQKVFPEATTAPSPVEQLLVDIRKANSIAALDALLPQLKALPEKDKEPAREAYGARKTTLTQKAEAQS